MLALPGQGDFLVQSTCESLSTLAYELFLYYFDGYITKILCADRHPVFRLEYTVVENPYLCNGLLQ